MADVIFEDDQEGTVTRIQQPVSSRPSFLVRTIFKLGLAKTEQGAQYVLLAVAIVCIILSVIALTSAGVVQLPAKPSPLGPQAVSTPSQAVRVP